MSKVKRLDEIKQEGESCLRFVCQGIGESQGERRTLSERLISVLRRIPKACGLAAPQIGVLKRVAVVKFNGVYYTLYNPVIQKMSRILKRSKEICLSFSHEYLVLRPIWIVVEYENIRGQRIRQFFWYHRARVIMHEVQHLDGLCVDELGVMVEEYVRDEYSIDATKA